jgi:putative flippase GtrA
MSWIKKEIIYLKDSIPQIVNGFLISLLVSSGLGCAILLNLININGTVIAFLSIIIQVIALIMSYFLVRKYFDEKEPKDNKKKGI